MIDGLFRQSKSSGRLKLQSKKPVVLVLGTGWGAHSLVKVTQELASMFCKHWSSHNQQQPNAYSGILGGP
jgi:hypothetical protein